MALKTEYGTIKTPDIKYEFCSFITSGVFIISLHSYLTGITAKNIILFIINYS